MLPVVNDMNSLSRPSEIDSYNMDLAYDISQTNREKIQKGEFIDIAILLSNINPGGQESQKLVLKEGN